MKRYYLLLPLSLIGTFGYAQNVNNNEIRLGGGFNFDGHPLPLFVKGPSGVSNGGSVWMEYDHKFTKLPFLYAGLSFDYDSFDLKNSKDKPRMDTYLVGMKAGITASPTSKTEVRFGVEIGSCYMQSRQFFNGYKYRGYGPYSGVELSLTYYITQNWGIDFSAKSCTIGEHNLVLGDTYTDRLYFTPARVGLGIVYSF